MSRRWAPELSVEPLFLTFLLEMALDAGYVHAIFSAIAPRYVAVNHVLSMGIDILWRSRAVELIADWKPSALMDVATGTGDLALNIQQELPEIEVLGVDFCESMLEIARRRGLRHTLCADAMQLPLPSACFDAVSTAFGLRNMPDYSGALREFHRMLRPGGHLLILDFCIPDGIAAAPYRFYLHRVLPRLADLLTASATAYSYLGESIENFPRSEAMCNVLSDTGYNNPVCLPLLGGIAAIYFAQV